MWFIGMEFKKTENLNVDLTESIQNFTNLVHKHATTISLQKEGMEIEVRHVRRKQLTTYLEKDTLNRERKSMDSATAGNKKRISTEITQQSTQPQTQTQLLQNDPSQTTKRQRTNEYVSNCNGTNK